MANSQNVRYLTASKRWPREGEKDVDRLDLEILNACAGNPQNEKRLGESIYHRHDEAAIGLVGKRVERLVALGNLIAVKPNNGSVQEYDKIVFADVRTLCAYAYPCIARREGLGQLSQGAAGRMLGRYRRNETIYAREIFECLEPDSLLPSRLGSLAQRMGKETVDEEVYDRFFIEEHDPALDNKQILPQAAVRYCYILPFFATSVPEDGRFATGRTPFGNEERASLALVVGQLVLNRYFAMHWNYLVKPLEEVTGKQLMHKFQVMRQAKQI